MNADQENNFLGPELKQDPKADERDSVSGPGEMEIIGKLVGGIAHDFNNILHTITGYAELALDSIEGESDPLNSSIQEIIDSTNQASILIEKLLAFGQQQVLNLRRIDLNRIVIDSYAHLRTVLGKEIELRVHRWPDPVWIKGDKEQLTQVMVNLCRNARNELPLGGVVTLSTAPAEENGFSLFKITDDGNGYDEADLDSLFTPYVKSGRTVKFSGMDLASSRGILTQHHGKLDISSEKNRGTTITGYFPSAPSPTCSTDSESCTAKNIPSILIVDSDRALRTLTSKILKRAGYGVLEAEGTSELLKQNSFPCNRIDSVLLTTESHSNSVQKAVESIQRAHPNSRIILITDGLESRNDMQFIENNRFCVLQKPYSSKQLLDIISQ